MTTVNVYRVKFLDADGLNAEVDVAAEAAETATDFARTFVVRQLAAKAPVQLTEIVNVVRTVELAPTRRRKKP